MNGICIVTGAASGIGAATMRKLRETGWTVIGWDIIEPDAGNNWVIVDVRDAAQVQAAWNEAVKAGAITGLVCAAGIFAIGRLHEMGLHEVHRVLDVNLVGTMLVCRAAVETMRHAGGRIVTIASLAALRAPKVPCSAYAASKGGILAFSRALAVEYGAAGVRVNCIAPGPIETPLLTDVTTAEQLAMYSQGSSLGRLGSPAEVASTIEWLLSDSASLINGATVEVAST